MATKHQVFSFIIILFLACTLLCSLHDNVYAQHSGIASVQGARETALNSNTDLVLNLSENPEAGNVLVAAVGIVVASSSMVNVSAIVQDGYNWTMQVSSVRSNIAGDLYYVRSEIWVGVQTGETVGTEINVQWTFGQNAYVIVNVCEYAGVASTDFLDQTSYANGTSNPTTSTGVIPTTTDAPELLIAAVTVRSNNAEQHSPTNNFVLHDGAALSGLGGVQGSSAVLEKVDYVTGLKYTNTTFDGDSSVAWAGCMVALRPAAPAPYSVSGPFFEDGTVADRNMTVTVYFENSSVDRYELDGTLGVAAKAAFNAGVAPTHVTWRASGTEEFLRTSYFIAEGDIEIYVCDPEQAVYAYSFLISDFTYGMTNPYLETLKTIDGVKVIERKPIDTSTVTFVMEQWSKYDLRVICEEGTFTRSFTAEGIFTESFPILEGAFERDSLLFSVYANATRQDNTTVVCKYFDSDELTDWVYVEISHRTGSATVIDYISNSTGNTHTIIWSDALASTSYDVYIYASRSDVDYTWRFTAASKFGPDNPWSGLFSSLGSWPRGFDADQIPAAVIIICVLAIFSYVSSSIGIILSVVVAGVFAALGWFIIPPTTLVFGGFVGVMAHFAESKKTEREV